MDPISVVGVASAYYASVVLEVLGQHYDSLKRYYGPFVALLVSVSLPDTAKQYERVERVVLQGKPENALAFRQAVTDECNMTAVAGAIIAQVAITGLSLPALSSTHWVARAFFLFAVASGCLAVYYCCVLQRTIGKLYSAQMIRDWLSLPPAEGRDDRTTPGPSLAAILITSAPFNMMKASIFAFLLGLAIYQGFTWTRALDPNAGRGDSRNVFITFIVGTGACVLFYLNTFSLKTLEIFLRIGRSKLNGTSQIPLGDMGHQVDEVVVRGGLSAALEAAALAHTRCAEADQRVALEYSRASGARRNSQADID